jgi:hypothetical protein
VKRTDLRAPYPRCLDLSLPLPRRAMRSDVELAAAIERHNREVARLLADTDYRSVLTKGVK